MDTITDFGTGSDGLHFDATAFTNGGLSAGAALGAGEFISGTTIDATSADGTSIFMYNTTSGNLYYDADSASGGGILVLNLSNQDNLESGEILTI